MLRSIRLYGWLDGCLKLEPTRSWNFQKALEAGERSSLIAELWPKVLINSSVELCVYFPIPTHNLPNRPAPVRHTPFSWPLVNLAFNHRGWYGASPFVGRSFQLSILLFCYPELSFCSSSVVWTGYEIRLLPADIVCVGVWVVAVTVAVTVFVASEGCRMKESFEFSGNLTQQVNGLICCYLWISEPLLHIVLWFLVSFHASCPGLGVRIMWVSKTMKLS